MRLTCHGAAGEVTGSCHLLETDRARLLVDCGLFQGGSADDERNLEVPPVTPESLDAVILTHAHLDHSGRLPLLVASGYRRRVYCTAATADLAELLLEDAARIRSGDRQEAGTPGSSQADVREALARLTLVRYDEPFEPVPGVRATLHDAGHILGSAMIDLAVRDGDRERRVVFSGDLGERGTPLLRDPHVLREADAVLLESTYGDRDHRPLAQTVEEFAAIVRDVASSRGVMLVPAFAVGRTQQLIYHLAELIRADRVPPIPVFVDSPMATSATGLYRRHTDLLDEPTRRILRSGSPPLDFRGLRFTRSSEESRDLNTLDGPAIIIAGAGMCTGGRILHHLRHRIARPDTHLMFVGFQAAGTLGRRIVDRASTVRIFGEEFAVRARVHTLGGFSAHAGQSGLLAWAGAFAAARPRVILVHGENPAREALRAKLAADTGLEASCPGPGDKIQL